MSYLFHGLGKDKSFVSGTFFIVATDAILFSRHDAAGFQEQLVLAFAILLEFWLIQYRGITECIQRKVLSSPGGSLRTTNGRRCRYGPGNSTCSPTEKRGAP